MKTSISALVLATLMIAGPVSAVSISDLDSPVDTASVMLSVNDDGIATLTGDVRGIFEKGSLENATMDLEGVTQVRKLSYLLIVRQLTLKPGKPPPLLTWLFLFHLPHYIRPIPPCSRL